MSQTTCDISVIICAYTNDRWDNLIAAVESVQQQTFPPKEIIVVIDHNQDLLKRIREHIPGVIAMENQEAKGLSGARNSGAFIAQSEVIAFLDDDAVSEPNWIENLIGCYTSPSVVGVGGKIEPLWLKSRPFWFPDEFGWVVGCTYQGMPITKAPVRNVIGANMSVRRQVLLAVGGFRESFGCNHNNTTKGGTHSGLKWLQHHAGDEETEFCIRIAQQRLDSTWLYTPQAIIRHRVPPQRTRWAYFLWRCYDEGLGKAMLVRLRGAQAGLSSERAYAFKALPKGVVRGLTDVFRHRDLTGLARAGAIAAGLTTTVAGYLMGTVSQFLAASKGGYHGPGIRL